MTLDCKSTMTPSLKEIRTGGVDEISGPDTPQLPTGQDPGKPTRQTDEPVQEEPSLADRAIAELAEMQKRCALHRRNSNSQLPTYREAFPVACRSLLHSLAGNRNCIDCNVRDPEWAAISYGALVCIKCSGKHRSMGVAISQVRSVAMDHWTHKEVVLMLEGGNAQLGGFFGRHALTEKEFERQEKIKERRNNSKPSDKKPSLLTAENVTSVRYKTKAALFYKNQLEAHVGRLLEDPVRKPYRGRSRSETSQQ